MRVLAIGDIVGERAVEKLEKEFAGSGIDVSFDGMTVNF